MPAHRLLHLRHRRAQIGALQAPGHHDHLLQIFAPDLILRRQLRRRRQRAQCRGVPLLLLKTVFWIASSEARCHRGRRTRIV